MDDKEIKKFFSFITEGYEDKYYYTALIARPKYLSTEERNGLKANMLDIQLYKHTEGYSPYLDYRKLLHRFNVDPMAYLTRTGYPIPDKARAIYGGINPVDPLSAVAQFKKDLAALEEKYLRNDLDFRTEYTKLPRVLAKQFTKYPLVKANIDIDVDVVTQDGFVSFLFDGMTRDFAKQANKDQLDDLLFVFTKGGFHILSHKNHMNKDWNTKSILDTTHNWFDSVASEVKQNDNNMCPIPGTKQCDFDVFCRTFEQLYTQ